MVDVVNLHWHYRAMIGKTKTPPKRKPLRQRVADRKAGRDRYVEEEPSVLLWRKRLGSVCRDRLSGRAMEYRYLFNVAVHCWAGGEGRD